MSQNVDMGLSFCFIVCRRWKLGNKYKTLQKLPVFCHKIKTEAKIQKLRHASLGGNVLYTHTKVDICKSNIQCSKNKSENIGYKFAIIEI